VNVFKEQLQKQTETRLYLSFATRQRSEM